MQTHLAMAAGLDGVAGDTYGGKGAHVPRTLGDATSTAVYAALGDGDDVVDHYVQAAEQEAFTAPSPTGKLPAALNAPDRPPKG